MYEATHSEHPLPYHPQVWIAADGSYHAIVHDEQGLPGRPLSRGSAYGRHAWSRTGGLSNWSISPWGSGSLAYTSEVQLWAPEWGGQNHVPPPEKRVQARAFLSKCGAHADTMCFLP